MRIEVGSVRAVSEGALFVALAACGYGFLAPEYAAPRVSAPMLCIVHFVAAYTVTLLSFATFARSRRTDLARIVIMVAVLGEIVQVVLGRGLSLSGVACDTLGAMAVFVPSFMERFRSLVRSDPREPFAMVYPNDRRRRRSGRVAAPRTNASA